MTHRRLVDDRGASSVEYALLIVGVAALIIVAVFALGGTVDGAFTHTCDVVDREMSASTDCG